MLRSECFPQRLVQQMIRRSFLPAAGWAPGCRRSHQTIFPDRKWWMARMKPDSKFDIGAASANPPAVTESSPQTTTTITRTPHG